jgi:opacity protein-like surface antigen
MAGSFNQLRLRFFIVFVLPGLLLLSLSRPGISQESRYTFHGGVGGGYSPLVGRISSRLDNGWHVRFGGGVNLGAHLATSLDYTYHGLGVSRAVLNEAQVPNGNAHLWSLTLDPKFRLNVNRKLDPYVVGGVGYYRRVVEFTQPAVTSVYIFDPFFGGFYNTYVPADQVLGRITDSGIGGNLGAGFDFKVGGGHTKLFAEARYTYADTGRIPTRMVPVTFGIRW